MAFTFFPVFFSLILFPVSMVGPCSYLVFVTASNTAPGIADGKWLWLGIDGVAVVYLALYCGLFYLCARLTFCFSQKWPHPVGRTFLKIIFLLIIFSSSFLNVIHANSFANSTGTYDFWSGYVRFMKPFNLGYSSSNAATR
jgi:hypothetical protein